MTVPAQPDLSVLKDATVIFDLDGTLIDTAPDLARATTVALAAEGRPPVPFEDLRLRVGLGAKRLIDYGLERSGGRVDEARMEALIAIFLDHYMAHIAQDSRPFPGALAAMETIETAGGRLAICTNKKEAVARHLLDTLGLTQRFAAIIGADTLPVRKPDPAPVLAAATRAGGTPATAVMIGDTITDIEAAKAARVPVVAVRFGYSETPVDALGPDAVIDHFDALTGVLIQLLNRGGIIPAQEA